uniref:Uncharacterized protein n=1 Tax=Anguilla anguilla TaxID=7936 RepID=A0A0E9TXH5_ANGAN
MLGAVASFKHCKLGKASQGTIVFHLPALNAAQSLTFHPC